MPSVINSQQVEQYQQAVSLAHQFYREQMEVVGNPAQAYLTFRQTNYQTTERLQLGYSPDHQGLVKYLRHHGMDLKVAEKAGVLNYNEEKSRFYDTFHHRLIFPIFDAEGRVVAFSGRRLSQDQTIPKYLNSRENVLFKKSHLLYGFHWAQESIRREKHVLFVEGYMDYLALVDSGIENVVAPMGTNITLHQVRQVKDLVEKYTLVFDGDNPGKRAANMAADVLLTTGGAVHVVTLPSKMDPDEFRRTYGQEGLWNYIREQSQDMILARARETLFGGPVDRYYAMEAIVKSVCFIPDAVTRHKYLVEIARIAVFSLITLKEYEQEILLKKTSSPASEKLRKRLSRNPEFLKYFESMNSNRPSPSFVDGIIVRWTPEKIMLRSILRFPKFWFDVGDTHVNICDRALDFLGKNEIGLPDPEDWELAMAMFKLRQQEEFCLVGNLEKVGYKGSLASTLIQEKFSFSELMRSKGSGPIEKYLNSLHYDLLMYFKKAISKRLEEDQGKTDIDRASLKRVNILLKEWEPA